LAILAASTASCAHLSLTPTTRFPHTLAFTSFEYQQSKQVVAGEDIKKDILKNGIRKLERDTGVSHHTIDKILKGERVRRKTLAKVVKQIESSTFNQ
jgi:hypothetical protein